jgi:DNA polymerase I
VNRKCSLILDLESNGLLPLVSTIWVICTKVIETGEVREFYDRDSFVEYVTNLQPTHLVGQNHIAYDLEVLARLWDIPYTVGRMSSFMDIPVKLVDTKLISQFLNPDRVGGHSLAEWGERLGFPKGDHNDWSKLTPEMLEYCHRDVVLTERTLKDLEREMEDYG